MDQTDGFSHANETGHPSARFVTTLSKLVPGIGYVQRQRAPYARDWRAANSSH